MWPQGGIPLSLVAANQQNKFHLCDTIRSLRYGNLIFWNYGNRFSWALFLISWRSVTTKPVGFMWCNLWYTIIIAFFAIAVFNHLDFSEKHLVADQFLQYLLLSFCSVSIQGKPRYDNYSVLCMHVHCMQLKTYKAEQSNGVGVLFKNYPND